VRERGQAAFEAYNSGQQEHAHGPPMRPWHQQDPDERRAWAACEAHVQDLTELPASPHEVAAATLLDRLDALAAADGALPAGTVAQMATARAVLGVCDLIRTIIANAD
jgi:ferric-dicitrate binding protein FerR (iron transport regulator)